MKRGLRKEKYNYLTIYSNKNLYQIYLSCKKLCLLIIKKNVRNITSLFKKIIYIFMNNKYFKKIMVVMMEINIDQMCL